MGDGCSKCGGERVFVTFGDMEECLSWLCGECGYRGNSYARGYKEGYVRKTVVGFGEFGYNGYNEHNGCRYSK